MGHHMGWRYIPLCRRMARVAVTSTSLSTLAAFWNPRVPALHPPRADCPDCGPHGTCAELEPGKFGCKCDPKWEGNWCHMQGELPPRPRGAASTRQTPGRRVGAARAAPAPPDATPGRPAAASALAGGPPVQHAPAAPAPPAGAVHGHAPHTSPDHARTRLATAAHAQSAPA